MDKLRRKLNSVMQEFAWALVIDTERQIKALEDEKRTLGGKQEKSAARLAELRAQLREAEAEWKSVKASIGDLSKRHTVNDDEDRRLEEEMKEISAKWREFNVRAYLDESWTVEGNMRLHVNSKISIQKY